MKKSVSIPKFVITHLRASLAALMAAFSSSVFSTAGSWADIQRKDDETATRRLASGAKAATPRLRLKDITSEICSDSATTKKQERNNLIY